VQCRPQRFCGLFYVHVVQRELTGAFAMNIPLYFFSDCSRLAGAFARACIGACALTTHGQTTAMAETTVATNVHQTLDVHGGFAAQIALNGEQCDLIADFFQICVSQIFDFFAVSNAAWLRKFCERGCDQCRK
jgi:hypothetical protein